MGIGAAVGGIASLAGGLLGGHASNSAANAEVAQQQQALQFQQGVYSNAQQNFNPYIGAGQAALGSLLSLYGLPGGTAGSGPAQAFQAFTNTPYYQFPLQQSQLALNRQLAASGLSQSGAALRDATQLASGYASQGLGQWTSGLTGIAGNGQNAAGALGQIGNTNAQLQSGAYGGIGNAQAAGIVGSNNAFNQGIQNAIPALFGNGNNSGSSYGGGIGQAWGTLQGYGSALGQYLNPYGGTGNGMGPIVGANGMNGGGT